MVSAQTHAVDRKTNCRKQSAEPASTALEIHPFRPGNVMHERSELSLWIRSSIWRPVRWIDLDRLGTVAVLGNAHDTRPEDGLLRLCDSSKSLKPTGLRV